MIPALIDIGGPWKVLPPGVHDATLDEVKMMYAVNKNREGLFEGFARAFANLQKANCQAVFLDGSFVTDKPKPSDYDVCWLPFGVDTTVLDPVFLDFSNMRKAQKKKYSGEFFPTTSKAALGASFLDYFQKDKHTGQPKGIIRVR